MGLKPRVFSAVADRQLLSEPSNRPSADALNGLPATYGDAPKLDPPLPGDLGRPILESQRRMAMETGTGSDPSAQQAAQEIGEQTSELQSLMRISYAVFCVKKKKKAQLCTYVSRYKTVTYRPRKSFLDS